MKQVNQNDNEMSCSQFPSATYATQGLRVSRLIIHKYRIPQMLPQAKIGKITNCSAAIVINSNDGNIISYDMYR